MRLVETFDDTPSISLTEGIENNPKSSRVDGKYIIGMIEGQFFKPDGMSRNGRWYPKSLWTKALAKADCKNRLANSTMFGEIGHSDGPVEDMTLRQGCASHFIDDLWIDGEGRGMGRAYILGTPTGQLLKIYLGAGCKLKVSTRGEGNYKEGEFHDGCPIVDDDSYDFQTVDFVLNPGFLETSAVLKESYNKLNQEIKQETKNIQETIAHVKKEGEKRMTLDIDAYVAELKDKNNKLETKVESLTEQLQAKNNELLQSQLVAKTEVDNLKEELKPYKKLNVSAKTINENFKKLQTDLKKVTADKVKIAEELKAYKTLCGSPKELQEAIKLSTKSLKVIEEYRELGTPKQFKEALETVKTSGEKITKLNEDLNSSKETQMNESQELLAKSANYIKSLKEKLAAARTTKRDLFEAQQMIKRSKETIKTLTETANSSEALVRKYNVLKEDFAKKNSALDETISKARKLVKKYESLKAENVRLTADAKVYEQNVKLTEKLVESYKEAKAKLKQYKVSEELMEKATKMIKDLQESAKLSESLVRKYKKQVTESKQLQAQATKAARLIEAYKAKLDTKTVEKINESVAKEPVVSVKKDAIKLSEKFGCTVETAAKLINKNGVTKATKMLESVVKPGKKVSLEESEKLVEEVAQLDKVTTIPTEKTAKDFLSKGMIKNYFNHDAFGKETVYNDFSKLDGTKNAGNTKVDEILKKYGRKVEVEEAPKGLEKELTPAQAEAEAKKLLK